jgi:hypothetical protein
MSGDGKTHQPEQLTFGFAVWSIAIFLLFHCNELCKIEDGVPPFCTVVAELVEHLQVLLS